MEARKPRDRQEAAAEVYVEEEERLRGEIGEIREAIRERGRDFDERAAVVDKALKALEEVRKALGKANQKDPRILLLKP